MPAHAAAIDEPELTIYETVAGRTYPTRVSEPAEWAAALAAAATAPPGDITGALHWRCRRCGGQCEATLTGLAPLTFDAPHAHRCCPAGLRRRLGALWQGADAGPRTFVPALPALPGGRR